MSSFAKYTTIGGSVEMQFEGEKMTAREIAVGRHMFVEGALYQRPFIHALCDVEHEAERRLPLPKVMRPRVVRDCGSFTTRSEWCVVDGSLRFRDAPEREWKWWREFRDYADTAPLPERVKLWADLLANPTEEVEA